MSIIITFGLAITAGISVILFGLGILFTSEYAVLYNKETADQKIVFKMRSNIVNMFIFSGIFTALAAAIGIQ